MSAPNLKFLNSLASPPGSYRGRLAPTPTGDLHLGHACTFSIAAARSRQSSGTLILRMEDLDRQRCRAEFASGVVEDLRWWGLEWREGPGCIEAADEGPHGPYVQSKRLARYLEVWQELVARGTIYPSPQSRKDVERALTAPHAGDEAAEPIFPVEWRDDPQKYLDRAKPGEVNWRFLIPERSPMMFADRRCGEVTAVSGEDFGDFLVWRKDGFPTYELAVVVDDHDMGITEVVRGEDLLLSTFRQLLLYNALGWVPPAFYHTPLICDARGERLAKRNAALSLRSFREQGLTADEVRNYHLPQLPGLLHEAETK